MARKQIEGTWFLFGFGFVWFLLGTVAFATAMGQLEEKPSTIFLLSFFAAVFIYFGLALLLQAGLGSFWNIYLAEKEADKDKPAVSSESK